jgi:hypothetical protein
VGKNTAITVVHLKYPFLYVHTADTADAVAGEQASADKLFSTLN